MEKENLESICFNCNHFFPASDRITESGICLKDEEFEPFLDELLDNLNFESCQDLVDRKKFTGEKEACSDYSEAEMGEEIDEDSEFGQALQSLIEKGQLNRETFQELLIMEHIRNIDFKTKPVDKFAKQLRDPNPKEQASAISSLLSLISFGNDPAFEVLFDFFQKLPPPKKIVDVHFKMDIFEHINRPKYKARLIPVLLDELYITPSNNTTRQFISAILKFLKYCPRDEIHEPLTKMLNEKRFSYRLKRKIQGMLSQNEIEWYEENDIEFSEE